MKEFSRFPAFGYVALFTGLLEFSVVLIFMACYAFVIFNRLEFANGRLLLAAEFCKLDFAPLMMTFLTGNFFVFALKLETFIFSGIVPECDVLPFLLNRVAGVASLVFELFLMDVKMTVVTLFIFYGF